MIPRYTRPAMGQLWSETTKYETWLEIEIAACEAMAARGEVPREAVEAIREKAKIDLDRIQEIEAVRKHDVISFVSAVAETIGPEGGWLHKGLTSNDVVDTAQCLRMVRAADLLLAEVDRLREVLARRAREWKHTPTVGRTHGVHAEPMTFGLKLALWYADMGRCRERLVRARETVRVGKLSGAVGTFSNIDPAIEEEVCGKLGLAPAPVTNQVIQRDRHAEYLFALAVLGACLEKMATEVRGLQRTDLHEVEEPFAEGQRGSSAMPHKKNPEISERVSGLARLLRGHLVPALENIALWHERDISHSSVERVIIPDSCITLDYMLDKMIWVLDGLRVFPERMRQNLDATGGLVFSQTVLTKLVEHGMEREVAYPVVQRNCMRVWEEGASLADLLSADPDVRARLSEDEVRACFNLDRLLANVDTIFARVGL